MLFAHTMIGRFAGTNTLADVSRKNLAAVVAAAALLVRRRLRSTLFTHPKLS